MIDDDSLVHMIWKMAAGEHGKTILVCTSEEEFMQRTKAIKPKLALNTPIYIDQNLAAGAKGIDVARRLSEQGYTELHLSTGDEPGDFTEHAFLKGITGKSPPWIG